jgi:hypothetical protein
MHLRRFGPKRFLAKQFQRHLLWVPSMTKPSEATGLASPGFARKGSACRGSQRSLALAFNDSARSALTGHAPLTNNGQILTEGGRPLELLTC